MTAKVLMVQGTASSVGKSVLVTALCRIFADEGVHVAPFKAQNMSNNSFVTTDGLEIGRAQAEQARAARVAPDVRMNPVLLKPEGDRSSQIVLMGRPAGSLSSEYFLRRRQLWEAVKLALDSLRQDFDLVVIEGAGSPAEINLRRGDIVNMRVARYAQAPVLLVGDIDNGGVFAHLVGTLALLTPSERRLVKAFVLNKFRGDYGLLEPGLQMITRRTGIPFAGVIRYIHDLQLADEDAVALDRPRTRPAATSVLDVAVIRVPHISNFDDFDPLAAEPGVHLSYVTRPSQIARANLVILPGTKNTRGDLLWLRESGLAGAIFDAHRDGAAIVGICGGYQMLGENVSDPQGVEGTAGSESGLGLLPATTEFAAGKTTRQVRGRVLAGCGILENAAGLPIEGYEIHTGDTRTAAGDPAFSLVDTDGINERQDGLLSRDGRVLGTYVHGLFANDDFRRILLRNLTSSHARPADSLTWDPDKGIDRLAWRVRGCLDLDLIQEIAGL